MLGWGFLLKVWSAEMLTEKTLEDKMALGADPPRK